MVFVPTLVRRGEKKQVMKSKDQCDPNLAATGKEPGKQFIRNTIGHQLVYQFLHIFHKIFEPEDRVRGALVRVNLPKKYHIEL